MMLELPKGVWKWIAENGRDISRIADALQTIAREATAIRRELENKRGENK